MRTIQREIVSALIFSKDGLLFQGKKEPSGGGVYSENYWHIPGGGVEAGEDLRSALIREIKEETGIDISKYLIELVDDTQSVVSPKKLKDGETVLSSMHFNDYRVVIADRVAREISVELSDEFREYRWCRLEDIRKEELTPPSQKLFAKLGYISEVKT